MSEKVYDGGQAFPGQEPDLRLFEDGEYGESHSRGMSLRDWFAGQALSYLTSEADNRGCQYDTIALRAYALADAMLAERIGRGFR
jgi:hypothetical protein